LNVTPKFPFRGLNICVDFDLKNKKMENMKKLNKIIFHQKISISTKLPYPIRETQVSKLIFITIPSLKFWAPSTYPRELHYRQPMCTQTVLCTWFSGSNINKLKGKVESLLKCQLVKFVQKKYIWIWSLHSAQN